MNTNLFSNSVNDKEDNKGSGENVQGYFRFFSPFPRISVSLKKV